MKLSIFLIVLVPSLSFGDIIQWQDDVNSQYIEQVNSVPPVENSQSKHVDIVVNSDRQDIYLDTLQRLEQIDAINKMPATAAGDVSDTKRSCHYAKNVLLEYKLELNQVTAAGNATTKAADINANIASWESHVTSHCR